MLFCKVLLGVTAIVVDSSFVLHVCFSSCIVSYLILGSSYPNYISSRKMFKLPFQIKEKLDVGYYRKFPSGNKEF